MPQRRFLGRLLVDCNATYLQYNYLSYVQIHMHRMYKRMRYFNHLLLGVVLWMPYMGCQQIQSTLPTKRVPLHTPNCKNQSVTSAKETVQQQVLEKEITQYEQALADIKQKLEKNLKEQMTLTQKVEEAWQDDELFIGVQQVGEINAPHVQRQSNVSEALETASLRDSSSKWLQKYTTEIEALLVTELVEIEAISNTQQVQQQINFLASGTEKIKSDEVRSATGRTLSPSIDKEDKNELSTHIKKLMDKENELSARIKTLSMVLDVLKEKQQQLLKGRKA